MGRTFNPEDTDIAKHIINYVVDLFKQNKNTVSYDEYTEIIKKNLERNAIREQNKIFEDKKIPYPTIRVRSFCIDSNIHLKSFMNYKYFPSSINFDDNEIEVCKNKISSKNELSEVFLRDYLVYYHKKVNPDMNLNEENCSIWRACKLAMKEVYYLDADTLKVNTEICSRMYSKVIDF